LPKQMIEKILRKVFIKLLNNLIINQFLILIKRDDFIKTTFQKWASKKYTSIHSFKYDEKENIRLPFRRFLMCSMDRFVNLICESA
jgi:hypothetical protein